MAHQNHRPRLKAAANLVFIVAILLISVATASAGGLDFSLHKLQGKRPGPTLLVVGGIQGDEPGGFSAASLLVTHYEIQQGNVWVVPNLNFVSIIHRSRGIYGDLNRKFAQLDRSDPEYDVIQRLKALILAPQIDVVLNLHDGSGFYRQSYEDQEHNPKRWGQCVIIDQQRIDHHRYGQLAELAELAVDHVNGHLLAPDHYFQVMNTRTAEGNAEMAKTLTYFAIRNGKPALGLEASKSLEGESRGYYHLRLLEAFMTRLGIGFQRRFEMTVAGVKTALEDNQRLAFYDNKIVLDMRNARPQLGYLPLCKNTAIAVAPASPIIALVGADDQFRLYHGNRQIALIHAQYFDYDWTTHGALMTVDGHPRWVRFGQIVGVTKNFRIQPCEGYRANAIGFSDPQRSDEAGATIGRHDFQDRFSLDRDGWLYRVEIYKGENFSGMILVDFRGAEAPWRPDSVATPSTAWQTAAALPPLPADMRQIEIGQNFDTANRGR